MFKHCIRILWKGHTALPHRCDTITVTKSVKCYQTVYISAHRTFCTLNDNSSKTDTETNSGEKVTKSKYALKLENLLKDPEIQKRKSELELAIHIDKNNGDKVPSSLNDKQWVELLEKPLSFSMRRRMLKFFWLNEMETKRLQRTKEMQKRKYIDHIEHINEGQALEYGLLRNSLFMRLYDTTVNTFYHHNMFNSLLYESKLIFDCSYTQRMTRRENMNTAKQIVLAIAYCRKHPTPFYIYLCNLKNDSTLYHSLITSNPRIEDETFPVTLTPDSPIDVFDPRQLVYLTPDSPNTLEMYNGNDIYVIGALVDKQNTNCASLNIARRYKVRHARLPLEMLDWGKYSQKSLTVNQVLSVLLDLKATRDWKQALQHVPKRKLLEAEQMRLQWKQAKLYYNSHNKVDRRTHYNNNDDDDDDDDDDHGYTGRRKY